MCPDIATLGEVLREQAWYQGLHSLCSVLNKYNALVSRVVPSTVWVKLPSQSNFTCKHL